MTVLIVDDEVYIGDELCEVFTFFGIECLQSTCVEDVSVIL